MSKIVLKVSVHSSGRRTLTQSVDGGVPSDLAGRLFGNTDEADFDNALNEYIAELRREGYEVELVE
jgi:hypothetical protein